MTVATVKSVATRFLIDENPGVLALKGAWGVGKTYLWNQIIRDHKNEIKLPRYCYVSLFGINSLADLHIAIFAKALSPKLIGQKLDARTINKNWNLLASSGFKKIWSHLSSVVDLAKLIGVPFSKNISINFDAIAHHFITKFIICFDDFERLDAKHVKPEELLGFISSLKEEKGCKIVLIFNEGELSANKDAYEKYREKIVDYELLYDPSAEEAAEIAFPANLPHRALAKRYAISLEIKNIRILCKIVSFIELIDAEIKHLHQEVGRQAVMTIVLLAWAYYEKNPKKPDIEFIRDWHGPFLDIQRGEKNEDQQKVEWAGVLRKYGLTDFDEFDYAISKVVECGYTEETGLLDEGTKRDTNFRAYELEDAFSVSWEPFHNTFADNEDELIRNMTESFRKSVLHISPINLDGMVTLFRELDKSDLADELINYYIEKRSDEDKLFDLDSFPFAEHIKDSTVKKLFSQQYAIKRPIPTLLDVAKGISRKNGWSRVEEQALKEATEDDFYKLFKLEQGNDLPNIVEAFLQFKKVAGCEDIGQKVQLALKRIGQESRLNKARVRKYGIKVDDPPS